MPLTLRPVTLFGSIFDMFFGFYFLSFEPYHTVDPFIIKRLLSAFGISLPVKGRVQSQLQHLQNQAKARLLN